ncbi:rRNA pseudouridine synthase [Brachyspira hyodysenteriae]|uniref:Pseudouridine synthase n=1 Tax=Brachyspira hyodysenteriae ATCC 27164 TaxID=1266923 RepID=A0A3B6VUD5_BRAHO|nr:pseudouridine synthase [Brachyspira hyodysenteriae]ANN63148.1 pseudouridylate synthase [Brachyspira hyodysenteriae ATCC 27164]KLI16775.1 pseudouridylate synthase [Brachyspira hyodysenteriae]KLI24771.1 pseudouridylate synthase [Brachyspira hyodysenteriae]KLI26324.1 pseudouridylate synthase [Brachyspira hyodysenteriae]KLI29386.1 pseudouridylate synthase [Brachyspira hyodysenteriae]
MRLNKYIASLNLASRREADRLIQNGNVKVNGIINTNPATQVDENDKIECSIEQYKENKIYIKLNKPRGYVVSSNKNEGKPIYNLIKNDFNNIYPVGRLDKDSSGLILFTNDGVFAKQIIGENTNCEKEYYVKVDDNIPDGALQKLEYGISLDGQKLKPAKVKRVNKNSFHITLTEGKNRQIRRMCQKVGFEVIILKRLRISGILLEDLKEGTFKSLTKEEIESILKNEL